MIKHLYANGDSFVFGQELDGPRGPHNFYDFTPYQRKHCWTGIIADRMGVEYTNEAMPGGSNQRMYRTTLHTVSNMLTKYQPHEIFVVLGISHNARYEFYSTQWNKWVPHMTTHKPNRGTPHAELWDMLTQNFSSPQGDHDFDAMMLLGLQNFLRINRVPYLMTTMMHHDLIYQDEIKYVPAPVINQRYTPRYYDRPSFAYWAFTQHRCVRAPGGHPMEDGHLLWADHIWAHITGNNLTNPGDLPA